MIPAVVAALFAFWNIHPGFSLPKVTVVVLGLTVAGVLQFPRVSRRAYVAWLAFLAAAVWSTDPWYSFGGAYFEWSHGVLAATCYLLLTAEGGKRTDWLKLSGAVLAALALYQRFQGDPLHGAVPEGRAYATIGSPVGLGALLAMALPVGGWYSPLIGAGLWATGSRGAWLAAGCAMLVKRFGWKSLPIVGLAVYLAMLVSAYGSPKDQARVEVWKAGVLAAIEHPVLGSGPDTFRFAFRKHRTEEYNRAMDSTTRIQSHAHNDLLDAAATTGLVGLAAWLWFTFPMLAVPSLVALLVNMKFNPVGFEVLCAAALLVQDEERVDARWISAALAVCAIPFLTVFWVSEILGPVVPVKDYLIIQAKHGAYSLEMAGAHLLRHPTDPEAHQLFGLTAKAFGDYPRYRIEMEAARALDPTCETFK